jgi:hypothetical protein
VSELTLFQGQGEEDPASSPFDRIRHVDEHGEHWFGRELQVLMGYPRWEDFRATIERAHHSLTVVQGESAGQDNFRKVPKIAKVGFGEREVDDYRRPDGRMRTTLDITPVGMIKVREMLTRHPLAGTDVWE